MIFRNKETINQVLKEKNMCIQVTYAQIYHRNFELIADNIYM